MNSKSVDSAVWGWDPKKKEDSLLFDFNWRTGTITEVHRFFGQIIFLVYEPYPNHIHRHKRWWYSYCVRENFWNYHEPFASKEECLAHAELRFALRMDPWLHEHFTWDGRLVEVKQNTKG